MAGIDTGTGGFPIDGSVRTYDVGSTVGDEKATPWSSGDIPKGAPPKDLSRGTKRTLASYLSSTTQGKTNSSPTSVPNSYPISHNPGDDPREVRITDEKGYPVPPTVTREDQPHYSDLPSGRSHGAINANILRGRQESQQGLTVDGNSLLRDAAPGGRNTPPDNVGGKFPPMQTTAPSPVISQYYGDPSQISKSVIYNRFNNARPFGATTDLSTSQFAARYPLGNSLDPESPDRNISYGRLAQIGSALSQGASLELGSFDPGNNPTGGSAQAAALLPGTTQLGVERIDRESLTARRIIDELTSEGIDEDILIDPARLSWGNLNNVQDQYSGISNFGMQLLAVALLVAMAIVVTLMSLLFSIPAGSTTPKEKDALGRYPYGAYRSDSSTADYGGVAGILKAILSGKFNLWRMLGMSPTRVEMKQCLPVGALTFFGMSPDNDVSLGEMASAIATDGAVAVASSPGYYAIMARSVSRSFLTIGDAFAGVGSAFGSGLTAGIKQLLEVIDVLRNSKFMRAMNIFCQLGDRVIYNTSEEDDLAIGAGKKFLTKIDRARNIDAASRSRVGAGAGVSPLTLAWAANRSPDLFIVPVSILKAGTVNGIEAPGLSPSLLPDDVSEGGSKSKSVWLESKRIPTEMRERLEDDLEAEYVPFYFHDVRTNEIVSFHAFLDSLEDGFSANYEPSDGIGRVEQVQTYKDTKRSISFSFWVVATSPADFDVMWTKINKIVTLMYPQYTEGRTLVSQDGETVIHAPFSQTIGASPMVRIRIGDLVRSNYSKFNIARLFGFMSPGTKIDGSELSPASDEDALTSSKIHSTYSDVYVAGNTFFTVPGVTLARPAEKSGVGVSLPIGSGAEPSTDPTLTLPVGLVLKIEKTIKDDRGDDVFVCVVEKASGDDAPDMSSDARAGLSDDYSSKDSPDANVMGKSYVFHQTELRMTPSTWKKYAAKIKADMGDPNNFQYTDSFKDLLSDEDGKGNAITRSFRSSGGKGLAGFINSMGFSWRMDSNWEVGMGVEEGRKAPKMCKVSVSFSPFHDIVPGLDHQGFNRAPVYPVGLQYGRRSRSPK